MKELLFIMFSILSVWIVISCEQFHKTGTGTGSSRTFVVTENGTWCVADKSWHEITCAKFDSAAPVEGSLARIRVDGRLGYIDKSGKYVWMPTN